MRLGLQVVKILARLQLVIPGIGMPELGSEWLSSSRFGKPELLSRVLV